MKTKNNIYILLFITTYLSSCNSYLDNVSLPIEKVPSQVTFSSESMIASAVTGAILESAESASLTSSTYYLTGLYTDVLKNTAPLASILPYYKNTIQPSNSQFWSKYYKTILNTNAAIEGINKSNFNLQNKSQWLGECYFIRAYNYFLLTNFYGDVPLALTTDYNINNSLSRASIDEVYEQIIADLILAKDLLPDNYKNGSAQNTQNRYRPNKATASALLSRVYLYNKDWEKADLEATSVIENSNYELEDLENVFTNGNKEIIFTFANYAPRRAPAFGQFNNNMPATLSSTQTTGSYLVYSALSDALSESFESGDLRKLSWVRQTIAAANLSRPETIYYFPNKYKSAVLDNGLEIPLRLAEQYLIRAEARAHLKHPNAKDDLNIIRRRAGLPNIDPINIFEAIAKERYIELFTEGAHRFFDLKRTQKINEVMKIAAISKETVWEDYMALFPIPLEDIYQNKNLIQNPGYAQ